VPSVDLTPYYQPPASTSDGTKFDNALALIQATLNGLDQNNFASGKIFDPAKLQQSSATTGQALVWNGTTWAPATTGGLVVIDDLTVAGAVLASYDTNTRLGGVLPTTYKDLFLEITGVTDQASDQFVQCRVNNDSSANYYTELVTFSAATSASSEALGATSWTALALPRSAGKFGTGKITVPHYNSFVGFIAEAALFSNTTTGNVKRYAAGGGHNTITAPVTRLAVFPAAGNFAIGTRFTLYGRG
jgi:hypothetical protein